ncbi:MAG: Stp1/IreP family PP2C-type Ser/Thr phosphatase [Nitrospirae bacterium]|nr:Stp1/IreP family PP2C-type Ser/Thr phosphatase [Nitrospirota bacterium]
MGTNTINYAGLSDIGRVRKINEDSWSVDYDYGLFIVSDGMGGHAAGDVASKTVVENLPKMMHQRLKNITNLATPTVYETVSSVMGQLSNNIRDMSLHNAALKGMGATVVVVFIRGKQALIAHMGDSRVYLLRDGKLRQVTTDHSVIQLLIDSGEMKAEDAEKHPSRGQITRCMGMRGDPLPEIQLIDLLVNDKILMCSDGLSGFVSDKQIAALLNKGGNLNQICKSLINAANGAGGKDNITAICIEIISKEFSPKPVSESKNITLLDVPAGYLMSLDDQGKKINCPLDKTYFTIGRDKKHDVHITDDTTVSRHHCTIRVEADKVILEDMGSRNGTYLNGQKVTGSIVLPVPSWFIVGQTRLAIVPAQNNSVDPLLESAYTKEDSILIPPTSFFEERLEAFVVVDLVGSTKIVKKGDIYLAKIVTALGRMLDRALKREQEPFLKCTGDGFFACFGSADNAFKTILSMPIELAAAIDIKVRLSFALHWGTARLTAGIERTGQNVHAVFSVEDLRHKQDIVINHIATHPDNPIIIMTEAFWAELSPQYKDKAVYLGSFPLKGFDVDTNIYCWCGN